MPTFHPDLRSGRFIPNFSWGPRTTKLVRSAELTPRDPGPDVTVRELVVPGPAGAPQVTLRVYQPTGLSAPAPALLWIHGGGLISGTPLQDERTNLAFVRNLGITVAAVTYRLAPDAHAPAAAEDAYAGLVGLVARADELRIDPTRIAVGGASAGGGLAAAVVLLAHDRGVVTPAFQLLVYPMLDDRTVTRTDVDPRNVRVWTPGSNRFGWTSYLGQEPGGPDVSPYAAPARRGDLSGLPPAWIGVGTLDLFYDEDIEYARRLQASGVATELVTIPGAFHGFDALYTRKEISKEFWRMQARALRAALR
ncbi:alpha/beta hydrolase [Amnibacterium flavum]|uniref:Alpha/beta hydrolase n=2 Tax=Amnibacterium flavum TaxID=2173173 RepID=A0A2V1HRJ6_9MICO|nr:alpha/beta hydrolase [Amnibacterium flavum]